MNIDTYFARIMRDHKITDFSISRRKFACDPSMSQYAWKATAHHADMPSGFRCTTGDGKTPQDAISNCLTALVKDRIEELNKAPIVVCEVEIMA